jgi:hypothetical protein
MAKFAQAAGLGRQGRGPLMGKISQTCLIRLFLLTY